MSFDIDVTRRLGDCRIDLRLHSEAGIVALFGPSGVGKTSVLNMVAGLLRPDSGRIVIGGDCLFDSAASIDKPVARRQCGYIFQEARLFPHMTVRANLLYGQRARGRSSTRPIPYAFDAIVALLAIGHLLDRWPSSLSGGEAQRVAIGRALLSQPAFLLMDEPFSSLDEARRREIVAMIVHLHRETAIPILYVSHDREEIGWLTGEVVTLQPS